MARGRVFVASMNMRGKRATYPMGATRVNVTSAQWTDSPYRHDFSPMHTIDGGYKAPDGETYLNFEHFWQGGKVWKGLPETAAREFFKKAAKPKRRYPKGTSVSHSRWRIPNLDGKMNYVESRKKVYVPFYHAYMENCASIKSLKACVERGDDVVVYDFDGPRLNKGETDFMGRTATEDKDVACMQVSLELLVDKINDEKYPFGHGYVVAALLAGIPYEQFTENKTK